MKQEKISAKTGVLNGQLVLLDTRTPDGKGHIIKDDKNRPIKILISRSLSFAMNMDLPGNVIASHLINNLNRTLSAIRLTGDKPSGILKVYIDAKSNIHVESKQAEWAPGEPDGDTECIVFACPGQFSPDGGMMELSTEVINKVNKGELTAEQAIEGARLEMRKHNNGGVMPEVDEIDGIKLPKEYGPEALKVLAMLLKKVDDVNKIKRLLAATEAMSKLSEHPESNRRFNEVKDILLEEIHRRETEGETEQE